MDAGITQETILKKTFELLLQKGYDGVSVTDIQRCTGMSRGLFYHYFGSKENLFVEATRKYFADLFYIDPKEVSGFGVADMIGYMVEKYRTICAATWENGQMGQEIGIMNYDFLFYRVMQESKSFEESYLQARATERQAWQDAVKNSWNREELRENADDKKIASYFVFLMDGVWMDAVTNRKTRNFMAEMEDTLWGFYELIKR